MALGLSYAEKSGADLLIGTDPDADRLGVAVRRDGSYTLLTGNEVGVLLLDYIGRARTERGTMPQNPVAVKSIVSDHLGRSCCPRTTALRWSMCSPASNISAIRSPPRVKGRGEALRLWL